MKKAEIKAMALVIHDIQNIKCNPRFAYGLAKNRMVINDEITAIEALEKPLSVFDTERLSLCKDYSEKDEKGKPKTENTVDGEVYAGLNENQKFREEMNKLKEKFKTQNEEIDKVLSEDVDEPDFHKISLDVFPDGITTSQMSSLLPLVETNGNNKQKL